MTDCAVILLSGSPTSCTKKITFSFITLLSIKHKVWIKGDPRACSHCYFLNKENLDTQLLSVQLNLYHKIETDKGCVAFYFFISTYGFSDHFFQVIQMGSFPTVHIK